MEAATQAESLRQLRLQNQKLQQEIAEPMVPIKPDPKPAAEPTFNAGFKALYACGVMDGMLKEALFLEKTDAANQIRETMKTTDCEMIRKAVGVDSPETKH